MDVWVHMAKIAALLLIGAWVIAYTSAKPSVDINVDINTPEGVNNTIEGPPEGVINTNDVDAGLQERCLSCSIQ